MPLSFANSKANAEFSVETVVVGAHEEVVFEISTREGRYDWQITSNSAFDGYLVLDEHFPAYRAGEEFPRVAVEENIRYWTPFLQTGGNSNHGIAVVNHGDEDMSVRVQTMFRTNPPYGVICLVPIGLLVAFGGIVISVIGIVRKIRKRSQATA